jgi:hypothetical protein
MIVLSLCMKTCRTGSNILLVAESVLSAQIAFYPFSYQQKVKHCRQNLSRYVKLGGESLWDNKLFT